MIRGRGHRPYRPPQLLTGHIDDFPLVPEKPIDIVPRPILPPPSRCDEHRDPERPSEAEGRVPSPLPVAPVTVAVQPEPAPQPAAAAENKVPNRELEDAAKSLKLILKKMHARDLAEPDTLDSISPQSARAGNSARRGSQRADNTANKNLSRRSLHSRLCSVCQHPDRDAIEEEFLHWHHPNDTRYDYKISRAALYRHAHALGLFARRERNLRFALGNMIQHSMNITPTSDSILRAIRAYSCLNRDGQWTEPPAHVVVSSGTAVYAAARALPPALNVLPARRISGGAAGRTDRRAKNSRQRTAPRKSNRKASRTRPVSARSTRNTLTDRKRRK